MVRWIINRFLMEKICREILSTNEGVRYAREFLGNSRNAKFILYEPLRIYFETI